MNTRKGLSPKLEKRPSAEPRKDREREMREAILEEADKTEGKDRDLVHGDGGTLGCCICIDGFIYRAKNTPMGGANSCRCTFPATSRICRASIWASWTTI